MKPLRNSDRVSVTSVALYRSTGYNIDGKELEQMQSFSRVQKIYDVVGRLDYIARRNNYSTKQLAEQLVYFHDDFGQDNWQKLADFETAESERRHIILRHARELIIALPNEMSSKKDAETQYKEFASTLASGQPYAFAVHWNKSKTNLHMHLLLSERQKLNISQEPKRYRQDIWAKEDGSMAMKKEDRHHILHKKGDVQLDKDGNIKYKDAENSGFSEKNKDMIARAWVHIKQNQSAQLLTDLGYDVTVFDKKEGMLAEKHEGKGNNAYTQRIKRENNFIRSQNKERAKAIAKYKAMQNKANSEFMEFKKDLSSAVKAVKELEKDRQAESICTTYDKLPETALLRASKEKYKKKYPKIIKAYLNLGKFFAFWIKKVAYKAYLEKAFKAYKAKAFNKNALLKELMTLSKSNFLDLMPLESFLKPFNDTYKRFKAQNGYIPKISKALEKKQSVFEKIKAMQLETKTAETENTAIHKKVTLDFER